jgi:hypothetical protein
MKRLVSLVLLMMGCVCASAQMYGPQPQPSYQGLWWNSPSGSEAGWGLNIAHQGNILFATWFTYDADGKGMWLVVPRAELQPMDGYDPYYGMMPAVFEYVGPIYRTSGPSFDAARFDPNAVTVTQVGDADFRFTSPNAGSFSYTVNGVSGGKAITRQVFSSLPTCDFSGAAASFQDLWWKSPANSESGWGINIAQQGDIIFATWFTYDASGKGMWLVASDVRQSSPGMWSGALYSTTGPAFNAPAWDVSKVKTTPVGSITFAFDGTSSATVTAVVNGTTVSKSITREVFASPTSACR